MNNVTSALSGFTAGLDYEALPSTTVEKVKDCLIDWLGGVYHAHGFSVAKQYVDVATCLGGDGPHAIIGTPRTTSTAWAAFANGALGHVAETDDGHRASIMHIGTVVFPVALALGAELGASGRDIITASVAGYDLAIRVGEALGPDHYTTWHTTATAGTFGAAACAARILGMDRQAAASVLGHAGTQAAGLWQFLEDGLPAAKPLHTGKAAFHGVLSARLAAHGIPGADHILEGSKGVLAAMAPTPRPAALSDGLGERFKVDEVNFKGYPTCGQTHSMIDAMRKIMSQRAFSVDDVERVEARVYHKAVQVAGIADPQSLEEAKFSIPFCLAFLVARGEITFTNITEKALADPAVRAMMDRTVLVADDEIDRDFPACRPCRVTVTLKDGTELTAENRYRRGDPETPMTRDELADKFTQLTDGFLSAGRRDELLSWMMNLENERTIPAL